MNLTTEALQALARQLSCPDGDIGKQVADNMQQNNYGMIRNAIRNLQLANDASVLELGHGDGMHIADVLRQAPGLQYTGLEISSLMYEVARENNKGSGAAVQFELYDGISIPLESETVDAVFTVNTIYFWKDRTALLASVFDVLRPGGKCCITFADKAFMEQLPFVQYGFQLVALDEVLQELIAAGFSKPEVDTQSESVTSQSGESVNRKYYSVTAVKR